MCQQKIKVQNSNGFKSFPHITNGSLPALPTVLSHTAPGVAKVIDLALSAPSALNTLPMDLLQDPHSHSIKVFTQMSPHQRGHSDHTSLNNISIVFQFSYPKLMQSMHQHVFY